MRRGDKTRNVKERYYRIHTSRKYSGSELAERSLDRFKKAILEK